MTLSKEQREACEKLSWDYSEPDCGAFYCCCSDDKFEQVFKQGFQAAQDPAMLLLNPLVKGLVEAIRASGRQCDYHGMGIDFTKCTCAGCLKHKALAPFKGGE